MPYLTHTRILLMTTLGLKVRQSANTMHDLQQSSGDMPPFSYLHSFRVAVSY